MSKIEIFFFTARILQNQRMLCCGECFHDSEPTVLLVPITSRVIPYTADLRKWRQNRGKKSLTDDMNSTRKKSSKAP
jgi:hypothetical protein